MLPALLAALSVGLVAPDGVDDFGRAAAHAGDVDDDGFGDVLIAGRDWVGLYRGGRDGLGPSPVWSARAAAFASAGDVDADGFGDVIIGEPDFVFDGREVGRAIVVFGGDGGIDGARPPWVVVGEAEGERLGAAVGAAGDVDGDGFGDVIIGSPGYGGRGRARVFLGADERPVAGAAWVVEGDRPGAELGAAVGTVWDVDADGRSDVVVAAAGGDGLAATVSLFTGGELAASLAASAITGVGDVDGDGFADVVVTDAPAGEASGATLYFGALDFGARVPRELDPEGGEACARGPAGDVNGDGYADLVGAAVGFGGPGGIAARRALDGCGTGIGDVDGDGFGDVLVGGEVVRGAWSGFATEAEWQFDDVAVTSAQDLDGDGADELLVADSAFTSDELGARGRVLLYRGAVDGPRGPVATLLGAQAGERFGTAVGGAGDVDGDGFADVFVSSPLADRDRNATGEVAIFWGGRDGIDLARAPGVVAARDSEDRLGASGAGVGDLDGDGFTDLVVGIAGNGAFFVGGVLDVHRGERGGIVGARGWRLASSSPTVFISWGRALGDVDGDGFADLGMRVVGRQTEVFFGDPDHVVVERELVWGDARGPSEVVGAGDFDGDGRGDLAFAASQAAGGDGLVVVTRADGTVLRTFAGERGANMGTSLVAAGDVDGDGYADLAVGAPATDGAFVDAGRVWVLFGGPAGEVDGGRTWSFDGGRAGARLGQTLGDVGDVDGDGFPELIVASAESRTTAGGQRVRVFRGNGGLGMGAAFPFRVRARRPGSGIAIAAWGTSDAVDGFDLSGEGRSSQGAARVVFEAEVKPSATPFDGRVSARAMELWSDVRPAELALRVRGLAEDSAYHWRARVRVDPTQAPIQGWSRWLYGGLPGQPASVHVRTSKNHAPDARDDAYDIDEDLNGYGEPAPGLLGNDADRDGDALSVEKASEARHGRVTVLPDGGWFYVVDEGYRGADGFDYRVTDEHGAAAVAHVSLYVSPGEACMGASRASCEAGELRAIITTASGPRALRCHVDASGERKLICALDDAGDAALTAPGTGCGVAP